MRPHLFILLLLIVPGCIEPSPRVIDKYPNGKVMTEYFYPDKNDTTSYTVKVYYENGNLKYEVKVVSNMFIGEKRTYFESGKLQRVEKLSQPVQLDDETYDCYIINYRPDGTQENEYQYMNDEINGLWIDYDSSGRKLRTAEYASGKMNGKESVYFPSGKIKSVAFVKNDTLRGFHIDFKENGDTLKWYHNGEYGYYGIFHKKWLTNGLTLTGHHGDSLRSFVVWKWWDKSKMVKSKIARSKNEKYPAPE